MLFIPGKFGVLINGWEDYRLGDTSFVFFTGSQGPAVVAYCKKVWNSLKILAQDTASGQFEIPSGASSLHWFSASLGLAGF